MFSERDRMIERRIRDLSYQPITEMSVSPIGESFVHSEEDQDGSKGERLRGKLVECAHCLKHFLIPFGEFSTYRWKRYRQKDYKKTAFYFCTYTHMKQWEKEELRKGAKL